MVRVVVVVVVGVGVQLEPRTERMTAITTHTTPEPAEILKAGTIEAMPLAALSLAEQGVPDFEGIAADLRQSLARLKAGDRSDLEAMMLGTARAMTALASHWSYVAVRTANDEMARGRSGANSSVIGMGRLAQGAFAQATRAIEVLHSLGAPAVVVGGAGASIADATPGNTTNADPDNDTDASSASKS